jgi:hypothetical protein
MPLVYMSSVGSSFLRRIRPSESQKYYASRDASLYWGQSKAAEKSMGKNLCMRQDQRTSSSSNGGKGISDQEKEQKEESHIREGTKGKMGSQVRSKNRFF